MDKPKLVGLSSRVFRGALAVALTLIPVGGSAGITEPGGWIEVEQGLRAIFPQPDGKILLFGLRDHSLVLTRLHSDMTLDDSFGHSGHATAELPWREIPEGENVGFGRGAIDSSMRLLIPLRLAHNDGRADRAAIIRFRPDGSLDRSFGKQGWVVDPVGPQSVLASLVVMKNGKIVLAGSAGGSPVLARLNLRGELDPTFGEHGISIGNDVGSFDDVRIGRSQIFAAGMGGGPSLIMRFDENGGWDSGFGFHGYAHGESYRSARNIHLGADGDILAAYGESGGDQRPCFAHFAPNGRIDAAFGDGGLLCGEGNGNFTAFLSDGGFVTANNFPTSFGEKYHAILNVSKRVGSSGGILDTHFGLAKTPGVFQDDFFPYGHGVEVQGLAVQRDGKPLILVDSEVASFLVRLRTDGSGFDR